MTKCTVAEPDPERIANQTMSLQEAAAAAEWCRWAMEEIKTMSSRLGGAVQALGEHVHTQRCFEYGATTAARHGNAHCIAECDQAHRKSMADLTGHNGPGILSKEQIEAYRNALDETSFANEYENKPRPLDHSDVVSSLVAMAPGMEGDARDAVQGIRSMIETAIKAHVVHAHSFSTLNEARRMAGFSPLPSPQAPGPEEVRRV